MYEIRTILLKFAVPTYIIIILFLTDGRFKTIKLGKDA